MKRELNIYVGNPFATRRKRLNYRDLAYEHIEKVGASYIPSTSNFFMMSVKGMTGEQVGVAMAAKKVLLAGNRWPEWPNHIRVTVGTYEEMGKFNDALDLVIKEGPVKA